MSRLIQIFTLGYFVVAIVFCFYAMQISTNLLEFSVSAFGYILFWVISGWYLGSQFELLRTPEETAEQAFFRGFDAGYETALINMEEHD